MGFLLKVRGETSNYKSYTHFQWIPKCLFAFLAFIVLSLATLDAFEKILLNLDDIAGRQNSTAHSLNILDVHWNCVPFTFGEQHETTLDSLLCTCLTYADVLFCSSSVYM